MDTNTENPTIESKSYLNENLAKRPEFKEKYGNFIDGKFVEPVNGEYFENVSPLMVRYLPVLPDPPKKTLRTHSTQLTKHFRRGASLPLHTEATCF
jgi:hypothetical protein